MSFLKRIGEFFIGADNQIDDTFKKIGDISDKLDRVETAVGEVKSNVDSNNDKIQTLNDNVANIESGISEGIQSKLGTLERDISTRFNTVDSSLKILQDNVEKLLDEQSAEIKNLRAEVAKVKELQEDVADKKKQIEDLNAELKNLITQSFKTEKELEDKTAQLTDLQNALDVEREKSADAEKDLQSWRDELYYYRQVRDAMIKCDTFKKFLEDRNLTGDSDIGLIAFVRELGNTTDFLEAVHDTVHDGKRSTKELMSAEELAVYRALNECYRHIWNIDFDVFCIPGRKPVDEEISRSNRIPFNNGEEAFFLKDENNKTLENITGIYVPLLLDRKGGKCKYAYVEAVSY